MKPIRIQRIAILGAAGKMGRGVLYLSTLHLSQQSWKFKGEDFTIVAFDKSYKQLKTVIPYTRKLLLKWAEKNINWLRDVYADQENLISNHEIIQAFLEKSLSMIVLSNRIESTFDSTIIFEAVTEKLELKTSILSTIQQNNPNNPWFLTNTSSIPIKEINAKAKLKGNIIGCHFYNPPAVQKLIEVIELKNGNKEISDWVHNFGKSLGKIMIPSNDIAGFIGNGFFMRDVLFAIEKVNMLKTEFSFAQSIFIIDHISRNFLLRPMGIFQLVDYVGIDVCSYILQVMNSYITNLDKAPLLLDLLEDNIKGGQASDGSQKPGFFTYKKNKIVSIYDIGNKNYISIDKINEQTKNFFDELPINESWKTLVRNKNKNETIQLFFEKLKSKDTKCSQLAMSYMRQMKRIGEMLVNQGVAESGENVNKVMISGFYHLYGPINKYC